MNTLITSTRFAGALCIVLLSAFAAEAACWAGRVVDVVAVQTGIK
jgi:hypothetical protein